MFVYLSKKIAIPNGVKLRSVAWNAEQGWIACGGDNGLLKVLKLELDRNTTTSNLSMNQTLDGHEGSISVVGWNEQYRKLTSSDQNGLIIVWMLHKGMWFEEMINNRNRSVVKDLCWTADGQQICIVYEDGAVIVGSVDGNRKWGKELKSAGKALQLTHVQWSPDAKMILFGTNSGEVHRYDASSGNCVAKLLCHCIEDSPGVKLCGLEWFASGEPVYDNPHPTLVICYENGRCQLMKNESDDKPILIDTGMRATKVKWNCQGLVLAIGGTQTTTLPAGDKKEVSMVQFYNTHGQHLRTLKVPGSSIASISWEGNGLRLALAVDSFIYFANVRPDYKWGYFNKTIVYAFLKPGKVDHTIIFWNAKTSEKNVKHVRKLMHIATGGDNCVLIRKDDTSGQHILILCNAIGSPIDSKYVDFEPISVAMTNTHVVVTSEDVVYIWQYRSVTTKEDIFDPQAANARRKEGKEKVFHIEDLNLDSEFTFKRSPVTADLICTCCISNKFVLVGRESGTVHTYKLPDIKLVDRFIMSCRPQTMELNCTSTVMSVIDIIGMLTFYTLPKEENWSESHAKQAELMPFERKDVWDMKWAGDNEELFAMMEKTRMYIFRGLDPEEPILSSANICAFDNLKIKAVVLDDIMTEPEHPQKDCVISFETKSLRDTRKLLKTTIKDAYDFIEKNPHPRLWSLLAEKALEQLNFVVAEKAFVKCKDYQGIQFVKRLKHLEKDKTKQQAEIAAYFGHFDDAERLYRDIDRKDLAAELRMRLGDWFKVVQLVQEGGLDDVHIQEAWDNIGDYYADRQKWAKAVQYYSQAKNYEKLVEYYHILEDYQSMRKLIDLLPEGNSLLIELGRKFSSVGLANEAVNSFLKADKVKLAVDACIELNQWSRAVQLAEKYNLPEISSYLAKYANHLVEKQETTQAIALYQKAEYHAEAAKLLAQLAQDAGKTDKPLWAKKCYVLAAIAIDKYKKKTLGSATSGNMVDALLSADKATATDKALDNAWKGAEAYHFYLLAQQQLVEHQNVERAMVTAMRLTEYDDILDEVSLYSLIALTAYLNKSYSLCSKAFIRLETIEARGNKRSELDGPHVEDEDIFHSIDSKGSNVLSAVGAMTRRIVGGNKSNSAYTFDFEMTESKYQDLAIKIFTRHPPSDEPPTIPCWKCKSDTKEWYSSCQTCGVTFNVCVISGRTIQSDTGSSEHRIEVCKRCRHKMYRSEMIAKRWRHCFLCHAPLNTD
ncbi:Intraflagellar transport protein 122-like protein [Diplonema papillatum]|nr:Intraflagellar transport protein 122-like protein [Diplonema papillatum]